MRFVSFAFLAGLLLAATSAGAQYMPFGAQTTVCQGGQCRPAGTLEPKLLFEQIHLMLKTNMGQPVKICTGNQSCLGTGISVPVTVQGTPRMLTLSQAKLIDVDGEVRPPKINLILAYEAYLNGFKPACQSAATDLDMTNPTRLMITSTDFSCALTKSANAHVRVDFAVDYIDLENAVLGGSYMLTVTDGAVGQISGHAFLRMAKKTPVTLDAKSVGLVRPDTNALLAQARADVQLKHQQQVFEQMRAARPDNAMLQQIVAQAGGQGTYVVSGTPIVQAAPQVVMQPVAQPVMQPVVQQAAQPALQPDGQMVVLPTGPTGTEGFIHPDMHPAMETMPESVLSIVPQSAMQPIQLEMPAYDPAYLLNYAAPVNVPPVVYEQ